VTVATYDVTPHHQNVCMTPITFRAIKAQELQKHRPRRQSAHEPRVLSWLQTVRSARVPNKCATLLDGLLRTGAKVLYLVVLRAKWTLVSLHVKQHLRANQWWLRKNQQQLRLQNQWLRKNQQQLRLRMHQKQLRNQRFGEKTNGKCHMNPTRGFWTRMTAVVGEETCEELGRVPAGAANVTG
jgi:hypothetical protein